MCKIVVWQSYNISSFLKKMLEAAHLAPTSHSYRDHTFWCLMWSGLLIVCYSITKQLSKHHITGTSRLMIRLIQRKNSEQYVTRCIFQHIVKYGNSLFQNPAQDRTLEINRNNHVSQFALICRWCISLLRHFSQEQAQDTCTHLPDLRNRFEEISTGILCSLCCLNKQDESLSCFRWHAQSWSVADVYNPAQYSCMCLLGLVSSEWSSCMCGRVCL